MHVFAATHSSEVSAAEAGPSARCCLAGPRLPGAPPPTGGLAPPAGRTGTSCRLRKGAARVRQATPRGHTASLCVLRATSGSLCSPAHPSAELRSMKATFRHPHLPDPRHPAHFCQRWCPKQHPTGRGIQRQTFTPCSLETGRPRSRASSSLSPEAALPGLQAAACLPCPRVAFPVNPLGS